jgi:hypothetical protein
MFVSNTRTMHPVTLTSIVTLALAVRGLALVRSVMKRGEEWRTNGHTCHLGHYQIDRITADGTVYAGCHQVPWTSIERIAPALDAYGTGAVNA